MAVQVQVRYYAAARELAKCDSETITLPAPETSATDLLEILGLRHPALAPYLRRLRLAINDELRFDSPLLRSGDVIDVMPPVAGGSGAPRVGLQSEPLSVDEALRAVSHPGAGGIALFVGVVRDHANERPVTRLDYEAHGSLAERELSRVANLVLEQHPSSRVCAVHRVGQLQVGELAVIVAASAPHRAEAFAACRMLIEEIKQHVPIWKKEWAEDGSADWVNLAG
ncbi:MAG TPA: molybdenum cofactor biosynthesis protein MoaE [Polyangiales bacterium]|nr:molybdenum cofactor biosynthesis protein MoaE [Polyangiales bacterium]